MLQKFSEGYYLKTYWVRLTDESQNAEINDAEYALLKEGLAVEARLQKALFDFAYAGRVCEELAERLAETLAETFSNLFDGLSSHS
jgi:hypothetical protein